MRIRICMILGFTGLTALLASRGISGLCPSRFANYEFNRKGRKDTQRNEFTGGLNEVV